MKPYGALLCLALAALPASASAAKTAKTKPVGKPAPAAAPAAADAYSSTAAAAVFAWSSSAPLTLPAVLEHFRLYDRELRSLSASFTQTVDVPETRTNSVSEGTVDYLKPERIRIEHKRPELQTAVTDGKDLWVHRRSQNQVIQSSLEDWKKADPTVSSLMRFGDYARMLETYDAALDTSSARATLTLKPKEKGGTDFRLKLTLSPETLFPETTELLVGSLSVRTALDRIRYNAPVREESFRFEPPAGAEVFRNFKPPKLQ
ncbi:MAG: outer membrane lipoprotein carrier protein LolA [Elusimicrobiota bacterium]